MLARQSESGARAGVFVAADEEWMDYLQARHRLQAGARRDIAGNRLVLIAPVVSRVELKIEPGFPLAAALRGGRLVIPDPDSVPAGRYARAALISLAVWNSVSGHIALADNVRSALMFVARGEAPLGIVYATDALAEPRVRTVAEFPAATHQSVTYPLALTVDARAAAAGFADFLATAQAQGVFARYGFTPVAPR